MKFLCFSSLFLALCHVAFADERLLQQTAEAKLLSLPVAGDVEFNGGVETRSHFSLGKIPVGKAHIFVIHLANRCSAELKIVKTESSCGCLVGLPSEKNVLPNSSVSLVLKFLPSEAGYSRKSFKVLGTLDGKDASIQLEVDADSRPYFELSPLKFRVSGHETVKLGLVENFERPKGRAVDFNFSSDEVTRLERDGDTLVLSFGGIDWEQGEVFRQRVVFAKLESRVLQEIPVTLVNPKGLLVRPTVGVGSPDEKHRAAYRFFMSGDRSLIDRIADEENAIILRYTKNANDSSLVGVTSKKRFTPTTCMVEVFIDASVITEEGRLEFCLDDQKIAEVRLVVTK